MNDDLFFVIIGALVIAGVVYLAVRDYRSSPPSPAPDNMATDASSHVPDNGKALGGSWHAGGMVACAVGAVAFAISLLMKTSVSAPGMFGGSDEVVNIGLQHQQGMLFNGGLFAIGLGVFCIAVGAIINAISSRD